MEPPVVQTQVEEVVVQVVMLPTMAAMEAAALSSLDTNPLFSEQQAALFIHMLYVELLMLLMCLLHRAYCQLQQFLHHHPQLNT
jgi:hypothetical protein